MRAAVASPPTEKIKNFASPACRATALATAGDCARRIAAAGGEQDDNQVKKSKNIKKSFEKFAVQMYNIHGKVSKSVFSIGKNVFKV